MTKYPTLKALADESSLDAVRDLWTGLGYYSRAQRLHQGAQKVQSEYGGCLPRDPRILERHIPGVGPYTAGAIASIAYNEPAALVDGNVVRVLSRWRAIRMDLRKKASMDRIWCAPHQSALIPVSRELARGVLDQKRPGHFNQGPFTMLNCDDKDNSPDGPWRNHMHTDAAEMRCMPGVALVPRVSRVTASCGNVTGTRCGRRVYCL